MKTLNIKKSFMLIEAQNIVNWFNKVKDTKLTELNIKKQWTILSGIKQLQPIVQNFEEFRQKLIDELNAEYFNEEKSEEVQIPRKDPDGNTIVNANGEIETEPGRQVKAEFLEAYQNRVSELNGEINQLLIEKTDYDLKGFDMDEFIEELPDDTSLDLDDLNMLSFLAADNTEGE